MAVKQALKTLALVIQISRKNANANRQSRNAHFGVVAWLCDFYPNGYITQTAVTSIEHSMCALCHG